MLEAAASRRPAAWPRRPPRTARSPPPRRPAAAPARARGGAARAWPGRRRRRPGARRASARPAARPRAPWPRRRGGTRRCPRVRPGRPSPTAGAARTCADVQRGFRGEAQGERDGHDQVAGEVVAAHVGAEHAPVPAAASTGRRCASAPRRRACTRATMVITHAVSDHGAGEPPPPARVVELAEDGRVEQAHAGQEGEAARGVGGVHADRPPVAMRHERQLVVERERARAQHAQHARAAAGRSWTRIRRVQGDQQPRAGSGRHGDPAGARPVARAPRRRGRRASRRRGAGRRPARARRRGRGAPRTSRTRTATRRTSPRPVARRRRAQREASARRSRMPAARAVTQAAVGRAVAVGVELLGREPAAAPALPAVHAAVAVGVHLDRGPRARRAASPRAPMRRRRPRRTRAAPARRRVRDGRPGVGRPRRARGRAHLHELPASS